MAHAPELSSATEAERYDILGVLGRGASSIVYRAFDRRMNMQIALKSLRFIEEEDIYELKKEFRFFRDIYHRNLVQLFDLYISPDACFFTMEAVNGVDFVKRFQATRNEADLRGSLNQFAVGLAALHSSGRLHRDIKPSNVLVEDGPRTVLLDFGLSAELAAGDSLLTQHRFQAGTPGYIAPERLAGARASPGSDTYGLGVVLYETLTGQLPYPNENSIQTYKAQAVLPEPAKQVSPDTAQDLSDLAQALLAFEPDKRASLLDVIEVTRPRDQKQVIDLSSWRLSLKHGYFVNREKELAIFDAAFDAAGTGKASVVTVSGPSGVGKSALIERFTDGARETRQALVLESRCHPQEFVQQKAVDGLVDALSRYLILQTDDRLEALCPETLPALVSLFPVLRRVNFPYHLFERVDIYADPLEVIDRATDALADILTKVAETRPVVLWMDDLQWSDRASVSFLEKICVGQGVRNVLTILSYRGGDVSRAAADTGAGLMREIIGRGRQTKDLRLQTIKLQPLEAAEVRTLVNLINADAGPADDATLGALMTQTDGLPYLVTQYANYVGQLKTDGSAELLAHAGIVDLIGHRLAALSPQQRTLLELVAVAGAPLDESLLVQLAKNENVTGQEIYELINLLLLRKGASEDAPMIQAYHDQIRRAVLAKMSPANQQRVHLQIADAMTQQASPDLGQLVGHYLDGNALDKAAEHALQAARKEVARFSYGDAVQYFELALEHRDWGGDRLELVIEHAEALGRAGRSAAAAEQYLIAVQMLEDNRGDVARLSFLRARAATKLLHSGQLKRGQEVCRAVFDDLGIPFPENLKKAQRASLRNRLVAGAIGLAARVHKGGDVTAIRDRATTLWEAAASLLMMDFVVGDAVFSWYLRDVARLNDPMFQLRADTSGAAGMANLDARWAQRKSLSLLKRCETISQSEGTPQALVLWDAGRSGVAWFTGQWTRSAEIAGEAIAISRREIADYDFVQSILLGYRQSALICMGEFEQVRPEVKRTLRDGKRRDDAFITRIFPTGFGAMLSLADDDVPKALKLSDAVLEDVHNDHFTSMHWAHFNGKANVLIYDNNHEALWDLMNRQWPLIEKTGFLRLQCIAALLRFIRARGAVKGLVAHRQGMGNFGLDERSLVKIAKTEAAAIARFKRLPFSEAFSDTILGALSHLDGNVDQATQRFISAHKGFGAAGMKLHKAATALHIASLSADSLVDQNRGAALQVMRDEKINDTARFADMLSPGISPW